MYSQNREQSDPHVARLEPSHPAWAYPSTHYYPYVEEEINLLDYWRVLLKRKWQIILITVLSTLLGLGISLTMPKKYKAEVTLMPLTNSSGGGLSSMMGQMGGIPLIGGQLGDLGSKLGGGKTKELVNILKSRTLTSNIINRFDLLKVIFANQWNVKTQSFVAESKESMPVLEDGVNTFQRKYVKVVDDLKTGLVKIQVTMKDPQLAANVANAMIFELQDFINNNSLTTAKRNRIFIEEQLVKIKTKLLEAGKELNQFYAENRISSVVPQLDVDVGTYQVVPKPFEEFREDLETLKNKQQVAEITKESSKVSRVPGQVYLQFLTLNRELLAKTFALLTQQYEMAKIEEAKEDLAFQVIDKAEVKVRPSSPNLPLNVAVALVGGGFLAVFIAFFREYVEKMKGKEVKK